jgi:hypothetical protein
MLSNLKFTVLYYNMEFMEEIIHGGAILDDSTVNDTDLIL